MDLISKKTKKTSLSDSVHDQILEEIIKNPSDEELVLNEKRLVEQLGVSRAPVREALIKLCSEGVLRSVPKYGYIVKQMTEKDVQEVRDLRILLETEALRTAFPKLTDDRLEEIRKQIDKTISKQNKNLWDVWDENEEFHLLLASFSGNNTLMKFLRDCMGMQKRIYAQHIWEDKSCMVAPADGEAHMAIYLQMKNNNLEGALELLRSDIRNA